MVRIELQRALEMLERLGIKLRAPDEQIGRAQNRVNVGVIGFDGKCLTQIRHADIGFAVFDP